LKLEIEYLNKGIFIHQKTYIIKVLKMKKGLERAWIETRRTLSLKRKGFH